MFKSAVAAGLFVLLAPLSLWAQSTGVPRLDPNYSVDVDVWWASHPFNPESPTYNPAIASPTPVVNLTSGQSIQAAIDALPAGGGTVRLGPGTYGGFDIIGRSNVHVVSDGGAVIAGVCRLSVSTRALDYGTFDSLIRQGDPAAWNDLRNPTRNFYFRNLIFDGGGSRVTAVVLKRVYDVVFDACEFRNFVDPRTSHPGIIGGHMGLNNIWYRNCVFRGSCRWVSYLDGCHGSGAIACTIELSNFGSGGFLYLTNDDFTEDINGNGRIDREEERNAKYIVIYGNRFEGGNTDNAVSYTGENLLVKKNTVTGPINRFVGCQSRWSHSDPSLRYQFYVFKILENTVADCVLEFLTLENNANPAPSPYQSPVMGRYTVQCNSFNVRTGVIVDDADGPIDGPNVVEGNCVNDPTCTPSCGASDTQPPGAPANLRVTGVTSSSVSLAWDAATDNVAVVGYRIERDGAPAGTATATTFTNAGLSPGTSYTYVVRAFDAAGNVSASSAPVTATTSSGGPSGSANAVINPSFESDDDADGYPDGWWSRPTASRDTSTSRSGAASLRILPAANYVFQNFALTPDTEYVLGGWIRTEGVSGARGVWLAFRQLTPAGATLAEIPAVSGTTPWTYYEIRFRTPVGHESGRLDLGYDFTSGTAWFDDIVLSPVSAVPPPDTGGSAPPPGSTADDSSDAKHCGATGLEAMMLLALAAAARKGLSGGKAAISAFVLCCAAGCHTGDSSSDDRSASPPEEEAPPPFPPPPPDPALLAYDSFTDGDGVALGSHAPDQGRSWNIHFGSFAIQGNTATNTSVPACATTDVGTGPMLVEAKITLPATTPPNGQGDWFVSLVATMEVRDRLWDGVVARFLWQGGSNEIEIWEFAEGGTYFQHPELGMGFRNITGRIQPGGTYTLRLWVNGRSAVAAIAGDELLTTCVAPLGRNHTATRAGLNVDEGGGYGRWDDFRVTSLMDQEPPQAPGALRVTGKTRTSVSLTWNPSADNGSVVRYQINRNGYVQVGTSAETSFTDTGYIHSLSPGTTYTYIVRAIDQDGNLSPPSNTVTVTTDP